MNIGIDFNTKTSKGAFSAGNSNVEDCKVFEVKNGSVRKFSGNLDYYLEKKESAVDIKELYFPEEIKQAKENKSQHYKTKENKRLEALERQKESAKHNFMLVKFKEEKQKIKDLEKERKTLETESFAKSNILTNIQIYKRRPETVKEYGRRLKEIRQRLSEIEKELDMVKTKSHKWKI